MFTFSHKLYKIMFILGEERMGTIIPKNAMYVFGLNFMELLQMSQGEICKLLVELDIDDYDLQICNKAVPTGRYYVSMLTSCKPGCYHDFERMLLKGICY